LRGQQAHELLGEQRVPAGVVMDGDGVDLTGLICDPPDQVRQLVRRQPGEVERSAEAGKGQDGIAEVGAGLRFAVPVGGQRHHRHVAHRSRQVGEKPDRPDVRPVQVVDDQQEGVVGGGAADMRRDAVEEPQAAELGVVGRVACVNLESGVFRELVRQLLPRPERRRVLRFPTPRLRNRHPFLCRPVGELLAQTGLPDACLPGQQHQPAVAGDGAHERRLELAQLTKPSDEPGHLASLPRQC
jgi:hypothetical protein